MPASTKVPQEIYFWVDDSGTTHFSNTIKKETSISVPPATNPTSPEQAQKQEKPTAQVVQPIIEQHAVTPAIQQNVVKPVMQSQVIKPPQAANGSKVTGLGSLVFMIVMVIAFRLFFDSIGKKRRKKRYEKIRELRLEQKPERQQDVKRNHEHTSIKTPATRTVQETIDIELSECICPKSSPTPPKPSWTIEFIRSLEWREFEKLCARVLETRGFHAKLGDFGSDGDGGKDIRIYKPQELEQPYALAQCKAQKSDIKVGEIRKLIGTMAIEKVSKGFFFASSKFFKKAWEVGKSQELELVTGYDLLNEIKSLPIERQETMLQEISSSDYITPTCTICGIKMIKKNSTKSDYQFWGCINFPKCQSKLDLRWTDK